MENKQDFTTGSITGKMLNFMVPILGALILQAMYSAVDLIIVGRFGTTEGISGVATGSSIMNMVTFTVSSLTTGVTVIMGRYLGGTQKQPHRSPDRWCDLLFLHSGPGPHCALASLCPADRCSDAGSGGGTGSDDPVYPDLWRRLCIYCIL